MAKLLKLIQAKLANAMDGETEEVPMALDDPPSANSESPELIQHPQITNLQQWLDLNA